MEEKRKELELIDNEYENKTKLYDARLENYKTELESKKESEDIRFQNNLNTERLEFVKKYVSEYGFCLVEKDKLEEYCNMKERYEKEMEEMKKKNQQELNTATAIVKKNCEMNQKVEHAELTHSLRARDELVKELKEQLAYAEGRLEKERELTQKIAEAGRQAQIIQHLAKQ